MQRLVLARDGNRQAGTSVVEVLIAASISLAVMGAFASFNKNQLGTLAKQAKQVSVQGTARSIAQLFGREIRRADSIELVPAENGIRIRADVNLNGTINDGDDDSDDEDVIYAIYDNSIWRKAGGPEGESPWEELLGGVDATGVELRFVDGNGNELTYASAHALASANPAAFASLRRARLNIEVRNEDGGAVGQQKARITAESTLRKRFFLVSSKFGVDDAIYADFDVDAFLDSLGDGFPTG